MDSETLTKAKRINTTSGKKDIDYGKYIPFVTAGLIFLGVSKLVYYYSYFGVNIVSFLEFGEILTSFLDFIVAISLVVVISVAQLVSSMGKNKLQSNSPTTSERKNQPKQFWLIVGLVLNVAYVIYQAYILISSFSKGGLIFFTLLAFGAIGAWMFYVIAKAQSNQFMKHFFYMGMVLIFSEMLIISSAVNDFREVKHKHKNYGTRIVFNDDIYLRDSTHIFTSDSSNFYIGKTNNYIFIHHVIGKTTSVYPMSSVLQIDLKVKGPESNSFRKWIDQ